MLHTNEQTLETIELLRFRRKHLVANCVKLTAFYGSFRHKRKCTGTYNLVPTPRALRISSIVSTAIALARAAPSVSTSTK